jgi:hypothetical protein
MSSVAPIFLPDEFNAASYFVDRHIKDGRADKVAIECGQLPAFEHPSRDVCQPAYRRQSQVDSRRSIWTLFEGNPVSCDHRPVEGESRL